MIWRERTIICFPLQHLSLLIEGRLRVQYFKFVRFGVCKPNQYPATKDVIFVDARIKRGHKRHQQWNELMFFIPRRLKANENGN